MHQFRECFHSTKIDESNHKFEYLNDTKLADLNRLSTSTKSQFVLIWLTQYILYQTLMIYSFKVKNSLNKLSMFETFSKRATTRRTKNDSSFPFEASFQET
jgi:hypothetical protein